MQRCPCPSASNFQCMVVKRVSCISQALEAYDLRLFEAGRFGRPVAEGTDELLDQAVKSLDRHALQLHTVAFQVLWRYLLS